MRLLRSRFLLLLAAALPAAAAPDPGKADRAPGGGVVVAVLTTDGRRLEGETRPATLVLEVEGRSRRIPLRELLSLHRGTPASSLEAQRIAAGLAVVQGTDRRAQEAAVAELVDLGLPVLTPLLAAYRDTDAREPNVLLHLFPRIVPPHIDGFDRTLDLLRLADGTALRGALAAGELTVTGSGAPVRIPLSEVRLLAVRRETVSRRFDVQALRHCSQIEFLDSGVATTAASRLEADAAGFVRADFSRDGWAAGPDGLEKPGPNYKTNLVDGFPFCSLIGRLGPAGARWLAGRRLERPAGEAGRLYFAVNDNRHWQNNLGSFRVWLTVSHAYDLGEPQ